MIAYNYGIPLAIIMLLLKLFGNIYCHFVKIDIFADKQLFI